MASGNHCSNATPKMSACRFYKDMQLFLCAWIIWKISWKLNYGTIMDYRVFLKLEILLLLPTSHGDLK